MPNKTIRPRQEKMIQQVAATMAVENMPLTPDCYKNLRAMASGEKTREQVTQEITEKYKKRVLENGCGMSPEFMKKMFIPFEREQTSTVSGVQGTGLGLPITKQFVELMHGSIKAVSEEGKGTEFIVRLNHRRAKETISEEKSENPVQEDFSGMRILLAEDNGLNREIAVEVLKEYGFEIVEAENGKVAVEKLKDSQSGFFDAILMDIQMPVMDGYMATREIRALADPQIANIPII